MVRQRIVSSLAALLLVGSAVGCVTSDKAEPVVQVAATATTGLTATPSIVTESPTPTATVVLQATMTPTATHTPGATPTPFPEIGRSKQARFAPVRIVIPKVGIDAAVVPVGVTAEGQLEAPSDYNVAGWYADGAAPGEVARAVLDGHLDSRNGPAVFYRLGDLAPGDEIIVRSGRVGEELTFIVRETGSFPIAEAPTERIFGPSERPELVLITCDGPFDRGRGGYQERLIVFAELPDTP